MSELENNYKKAFIKYVNILLPQYIDAMKQLTKGSQQYAEDDADSALVGSTGPTLEISPADTPTPLCSSFFFGVN